MIVTYIVTCVQVLLWSDYILVETTKKLVLTTKKATSCQVDDEVALRI